MDGWWSEWVVEWVVGGWLGDRMSEWQGGGVGKWLRDRVGS